MKRLIFTLLYDSGSYMLSRNFRLQRVGTLDWIFSNYDLAKVSHGLDEIMVIDVSERSSRNGDKFVEDIGAIARKCFIPVTAGGGIDDMETARSYLRGGADKLLVNTAYAMNEELCLRLADKYGRQCIVAGIDYSVSSGGKRLVHIENGKVSLQQDIGAWVTHVQDLGAGEVLLQSMDKDGTGTGPDLGVMDVVAGLEVPSILMGGVGKASHVVDALLHPGVDAVATANLFNFIGPAFLQTRDAMRNAGLKVATWDNQDYSDLRNVFA